MKTKTTVVTQLKKGDKIDHPKYGVQEIMSMRKTAKRIVIMFGKEFKGYQADGTTPVYNWKYREYKKPNATYELVIENKTNTDDYIERRNNTYMLQRMAAMNRNFI